MDPKKEIISILHASGINAINFNDNFMLCKVLLVDQYELLSYFEKNTFEIFLHLLKDNSKVNSN